MARYKQKDDETPTIRSHGATNVLMCCHLATQEAFSAVGSIKATILKSVRTAWFLLVNSFP